MAGRQTRREFLGRLTAAAATAVAAAPGQPDAVAQPADGSLEELTGALPAGRVVRRGQVEHRKVTSYNGRFDCITPNAYLQPRSAEEVATIIAWAARHSRKFAVRGGGHSFEGKSRHGDIVIDMSRMTRLDFAADTRSLEVGAGVQLGAVYKRLGDAGHVIPAGTCPTVGIIGHTLGGGVGDFLPILGFAAQALRSVTLVTFGATIITVDDKQIKVLGGTAPAAGTIDAIDAGQLMKALRGGGQGTFGIVTGMRFATSDLAGRTLAGFKLTGEGIAPHRAVAIIETWMTWREKLPAELQRAISSKINLSRSGSGFSFEVAGLAAAPAGIAMTDIRRALEPLMALRDLPGKRWRGPLSAPAAFAEFLDDDETTRNPSRKRLYGSSSALQRALPRVAIQHLVQTMPASIYASLYTSGGASKDGAWPTALHPSEFLIEWTSYLPRSDRQAHRRIKSLVDGVIAKSGQPDLATPNYPDERARNYVTDRDAILKLRARLVPHELCTSSLLAGPTASTSACA